MQPRIHTTNILRLNAVIQKTGLSRSSIYAFIKENSFPNSISLGSRSVGWLEQDVENWIKERVQSSKP